MDLFTSLLVKAISGILYVVYWLAWQLFRIAWWLAIYLLLSLGAGLIWLARGGRGRPVDAGRSGEYVEGGTRWQDAASGLVYAVSDSDRQYCEVHAEDAGTYWRRTAISRLLRQGAFLRYRLVALTDPAADGARERAAWYEFSHEARKNIRLDELNPALAGSPELMGAGQAATEANRDEALDALGRMESLLRARGWKRIKENEEADYQPREHWYADRYWRPVISWDAPITAPVPAELPAGVSAEQPGDQS